MVEAVTYGLCTWGGYHRTTGRQLGPLLEMAVNVQERIVNNARQDSNLQPTDHGSVLGPHVNVVPRMTGPTMPHTQAQPDDGERSSTRVTGLREG